MANEAVMDPMDTQTVWMDLEPPTPQAKIRKLRSLMESAIQLSKSTGYPNAVRKKFLDKADMYAAELKKLESK